MCVPKPPRRRAWGVNKEVHPQAAAQRRRVIEDPSVGPTKAQKPMGHLLLPWLEAVTRGACEASGT